MKSDGNLDTRLEATSDMPWHGLTLEIRRVTAEDLGEYCRVVQEVFGDAPKPEALRQQDERAEKSGAFRDRYIALGGDDAVAIGALTSSPFIPVQAADLRIGVQSSHRRVGIGSAMLATLEAQAARQGYGQLIANVTDDDHASFKFALKRGFEHQHDRHELELDLRATEFEELQAHRGYTVVPMTSSPAEWERAAVADALANLIALSPDTRDLPKWDQASIMSFLFENPSTRPEWIFLARERAALVGLSVMSQIGERAYAFFTGVQPSAQRRGVARMLKQASIRAAKRDGFRQMFADNLSTNAAMLALNTSLGFERRRTARVLRKRTERPNGGS